MYVGFGVNTKDHIIYMCAVGTDRKRCYNSAYAHMQKYSLTSVFVVNTTNFGKEMYRWLGINNIPRGEATVIIKSFAKRLMEDLL